MRDKPIEISQGSQGSQRVALPFPSPAEVNWKLGNFASVSPGGEGEGRVRGYTWANPWEVHASRMTPKALTIRRGSRALNDEYGVAVRRRTVRQETTMAKHGTLPEFLYQRHLEVGDQVTGYP